MDLVTTCISPCTFVYFMWSFKSWELSSFTCSLQSPFSFSFTKPRWHFAHVELTSLICLRRGSSGTSSSWLENSYHTMWMSWYSVLPSRSASLTSPPHAASASIPSISGPRIASKMFRRLKEISLNRDKHSNRLSDIFLDSSNFKVSHSIS